MLLLHLIDCLISWAQVRLKGEIFFFIAIFFFFSPLHLPFWHPPFANCISVDPFSVIVFLFVCIQICCMVAAVMRVSNTKQIVRFQSNVSF